MKMKLFAMILVFVLTLVSCGSGDSGGNLAPKGMDAEPVELFTYTFNAEYGGIYVYDYSGIKTAVKIPDKIDGVPVVMLSGFPIGQVTEVYFPETVKRFIMYGKKAMGAELMETIIIPKGVTEIQGQPFKNFESLKNIHIPDSVTKISYGLFEGCTSLKTVTYKGKTYNTGEFKVSIDSYSMIYPYSSNLPQEFYDAVNGN
jgi:hypothetical protein